MTDFWLFLFLAIDAKLLRYATTPSMATNNLHLTSLKLVKTLDNSH